MDEPTSSLTSKEIDDLFRIIRQLKAEGCGIVYISHRLEELSAYRGSRDDHERRPVYHKGQLSGT